MNVFMSLQICEFVNYMRLCKMKDVENGHKITLKYDYCETRWIHFKPNDHKQNDKDWPPNPDCDGICPEYS